MLNSSSHEFSQEPFKIKQDDKFFSRLLSKENSVANPSFRVYYGNVSGSVPFTWEIQPGTPKHKFSDNSLPPLTPPPSYSYNLSENKPTNREFYTRSKLLNSLFLKVNLSKNGHVGSSSPSNLSSSSWSSSSNSTVRMSTRWRRRRILSFGSDGSMVVDDGNLYGGGSPDSVPCFGKNSKEKKRSGGLTVVIMKKALLSIVGRRSG